QVVHRQDSPQSLAEYELLAWTAEQLIFRQRLRRVLAVFALAALLAVFFLNRYVYHGFGLHPQVFRQGNQALDYVAITFDDGPHPQWTAQILNILRDREVRATFFVVGRHVDRYPEVARRILEEGHEVGSHTYHHPNLLNAGEATVMRELALTEAALERAAGFTPRLFRPPRGLYNSTVLETVHGSGYTVALWSVSSTDWAGTSATRMVRLLGSGVGGGDIVLFHDSGDFFTAAGADRSNTVAALGRVIDALEDRGFKFVTVTELMVMSLLVEGEPP
ncbi:MAG: polysaccharide deacetylase family protein, partial [Bacillota bacterium]